MKERTEQQKGARRLEWLFVYPVSIVLAGAKSRLKHHTDRLQFWTTERDDAIAKLKSAGHEVREYEVTGGKEVQVVVDQALQSRLGQCNNKVREHDAKVKEFTQWVAVLVTQSSEEKIDLHMDDALYFAIAQNDLPE